MKLDFGGLKILVIGDPMADVYYFGHVDRISPEAPVPVFVEDHQDRRWGGAANVQMQLISLGCETVSGWAGTFNCTVKERFMVGSHQLLRVDKDRCVPNTIPSLNGFHAIVISDYAKGACTPEICQEAIKSGLPVIVDPKGKDWSKYRGCKLICPNLLELSARVAFREEQIIEKRGAEGLWYCGETYPSTAQVVYDVTGCGDVVVAVVTACVAKGIDVPTACKLANVAAGYAASKVGTTVCPIEYLCKESAYL